MSSVENPYKAPQIYDAEYVSKAYENSGVWRKGGLLVMHKHATLPPRCVKSNVPTKQTLQRKLSWHHPAVFLALLANLLLYVILALVLSKKATISIGLSDAWFARRRRAMSIGWAAVLAAIVMFAAGIATVDRNDGLPGLLILGAMLTFLFGAIYGLLRSRMVAPTRITDDYVWLKGVHPDYLAAFPEWPYNP